MKNYMNWRRKPTNHTGMWILGTVAGIAAGFTAGILTAPRPGKEIRNLLSSRTNETWEKLGKNLADKKDQATDKAQEALKKF